jgi:hypothetical protein
MLDAKVISAAMKNHTNQLDKGPDEKMNVFVHPAWAAKLHAVNA